MFRKIKKNIRFAAMLLCAAFVLNPLFSQTQETEPDAENELTPEEELEIEGAEESFSRIL